jgi:hypothetical protein
MSKDTEIAKFALYGEGTSDFNEFIQPTLSLRSWSDVPVEEKI